MRRLGDHQVAYEPTGVFAGNELKAVETATLIVACFDIPSTVWNGWQTGQWTRRCWHASGNHA